MPETKDKNEEFEFERNSCVAIFFSGLFNFYQYAAFEVKVQFMTLIKDYMLKLKKELIMSLPGFMLCIIPAFDEQNQDILKQVEEILI
jgi:hypothetical protein